MRGEFLVGGAFGLLVAVGLVGLGSSSEQSANESVMDRVKHDNRRDPWMKHVTDWDTERDITVGTDYPPDLKSSWLAAYEICSAVKQSYAKDANDLPTVTVNGTQTRISIMVDGSKHRHTKTVQLATSAKHHDFVCGITPPKDKRDEARKLGIPVFLY